VRESNCIFSSEFAQHPLNSSKVQCNMIDPLMRQTDRSVCMSLTRVHVFDVCMYMCAYNFASMYTCTISNTGPARSWANRNTNTNANTTPTSSITKYTTAGYTDTAQIVGTISLAMAGCPPSHLCTPVSIWHGDVSAVDTVVAMEGDRP
jgi:hypothetical protein